MKPLNGKIFLYFLHCDDVISAHSLPPPDIGVSRAELSNAIDLYFNVYDFPLTDIEGLEF